MEKRTNKLKAHPSLSICLFSITEHKKACRLFFFFPFVGVFVYSLGIMFFLFERTPSYCCKSYTVIPPVSLSVYRGNYKA